MILRNASVIQWLILRTIVQRQCDTIVDIVQHECDAVV